MIKLSGCYSCRSVIYKEQVRLNQAAASALMATLEAQKAICDSSERELHKKFKQRDELEKQIIPNWNQTRKRSRMDDSLTEEADQKMILYSTGGKLKTKMHMEISDDLLEENALYLQGIKPKFPSHKQLRKFLEEEQKASEAGGGSSFKCEEIEGRQEENKETILKTSTGKPGDSSIDIANDIAIDRKLKNLDTLENGMICNIPRFPASNEPEDEEDEEIRKQRGKGNIEKWLQMLLEENGEVDDDGDGDGDASANPQNVDPGEAVKSTDEIIRKLDLVYPLKELAVVDQIESQQLITVQGGDKNKNECVQMEARKSLSNNGEKVGLKTKVMLELKCRDTLPMKNPPYRIRPEKKNADHHVENCTQGLEKHLRDEKKEKELARSESARTFRRIPSSPSLILSGMKKRVDCIGKKPLVMGDDVDADEKYIGENSILKSTIKTIKRAVKI